MGITTSQPRSTRIWNEICAMNSDTLRYQMIETILATGDPLLLYDAKSAGVYANVLFWLIAARQGNIQRFPYAAAPASASAPSALVLHPAAKAKDYFQQSLELLGIGEDEEITMDRLKSGYRSAALRAHPDKPGGSKEAFDEVARAFKYIEQIVERIGGGSGSGSSSGRFTTPVTPEAAIAARAGLEDVAHAHAQTPVRLSAKKLDMGTFNKLFEENRLPDPGRDSGYGDWMKSSTADIDPDNIAADPRLKGKYNSQAFEAVFRERTRSQVQGAIVKKLEPDAIIASAGTGTEIGGDTSNFTAPFGSETQFMDLKEAYTTGSTRFQEVADVKVSERSARSVDEAKRIRAAEMARVDPDESSRIAAAAAALEERERQRRLRAAKQDVAESTWWDQMKGRLFVSDK